MAAIASLLHFSTSYVSVYLDEAVCLKMSIAMNQFTKELAADDSGDASDSAAEEGSSRYTSTTLSLMTVFIFRSWGFINSNANLSRIVV